MNTPLRCSGMARGMVHSANGVPNLVLIYRSRRDGRLSWPWVAGWLHTEISVWHHKFNPDRFAHLSTNRTRRTLTSLIEANALTTMPDHQLLTTTRLVSNYPPNCPLPGKPSHHACIILQFLHRCTCQCQISNILLGFSDVYIYMHWFEKFSQGSVSSLTLWGLCWH